VKVLSSYVLRQCLGASLLSLVVLLGVVMVLFFAELLGDAARGNLPGRLLMNLFVLRIPEALVLVAPLALMTGVLLAMGRLSEQSELTVMRAGGWSAGGLVRPLLYLFAGWGLVLFLVSGWVGPHTARVTGELMETAAQEALVTGLSPGRFQRLDQGRLNLYVERAGQETGELEDLFIHRRLGDRAEVTTAASGRFWIDSDTGERFLTLYDGRQVEHGTGPGGLRRVSFERNDIRLPPPTPRTGVEPRQMMALQELRLDGENDLAAEWHWRLASPIAAVVLGLLALPLSLGSFRRSSHGRIILALGIYLIYSNLINLGILAVEQGRVSGAAGLWPIHLLVGVLAVILWQRTHRKW